MLPALWPALGFAALYFALALSGLFALVPWALQALLLAATITATGLALEAGFRGFRMPALERWRQAAGARQRPQASSHLGRR